MKTSPADIFNYVVETLPDGETLSIDCENSSQLDRIRMALYRQRSKLEKIAPELATTITISKRVKDGSYSIVIGKDVESIELFTFDQAGNKQPLTLETKDAGIKNDRIRQLMLKEGKSEEEIEEYFQNN